MKKLLLAGMALLTATAAQAQDAEQLLQRDCSRCHGTEIYTRTDRRVGNINALEAQVRRCDANLGRRWFDEDIHAVVKHLNNNHYKFK
ncbi:hypothetical protein [Solemya velum gill symbiont]|uniref:hypothetical protein n=1 Tax=Solemya velum gill symbiont TaxID=2340 RepID=UPI000997AFDD|nr:hypothetical protein [Solemya velum gill symbiont]OOZ00177.1 hypothetical protein BOW19_01555 [Solemya velum gill symbiont]OOZ02336.1 hypothetical protein BOW20_01550 [Solemya velum gill symbiont]OOZ04693.1 hypothetical protein BOW21_01560 [Solemya velum gill symbiont]OOZ06932.1 hypothetical protein BOW22_01545 [Solemya velum gill symbiont]OOZ09115.1 hypothetical protein BOW23_01540 [Solemya velum gill symbiont]